MSITRQVVRRVGSVDLNTAKRPTYYVARYRRSWQPWWTYIERCHYMGSSVIRFDTHEEAYAQLTAELDRSGRPTIVFSHTGL